MNQLLLLGGLLLMSGRCWGQSNYNVSAWVGTWSVVATCQEALCGSFIEGTDTPGSKSAHLWQISYVANADYDDGEFIIQTASPLYNGLHGFYMRGSDTVVFQDEKRSLPVLLTLKRPIKGLLKGTGMNCRGGGLGGYPCAWRYSYASK